MDRSDAICHIRIRNGKIYHLSSDHDTITLRIYEYGDDWDVHSGEMYTRGYVVG